MRIGSAIFMMLCGVFLPSFAGSAEPAADSAKISALIDQLGHEEFAMREQAGEDLFQIGFAAYKQLNQATSHSDREIRYRAERLLSRIREADLSRRLELFLQGKDEDAEYPIPGWKAFDGMFGDSRESREFYVSLQKSEPELFEDIENNLKGLPDTLAQRAMQIQQEMQVQRTQLTAGQISALLFAGMQSDLPQQTAAMIQSFCYQQQFRDAIQNQSATQSLTRKLLGTWIERAEDNAAYQAMMLAMQFEMDAGLKPALKMLENVNQQPYILQFALLTVAKFGKPEHVPVMEKLLDNNSVVNNSTVNGKRRQTQLRDVALASLIHLSKRDHKEFGFNNLQQAQPYLFNVSTLGFESDSERDEALKKWKALEKKVADDDQPEKSSTEPEKK